MKYMVKLGDICTVVSGTTPKTGNKNYWDGDILWITPAELSDESFIINNTVRKITQKAVKESGLKPFPEGTVILSSRAPIGKVAIAGKEMYCNQGFKNLICSDRLNREYLYWFLKGKNKYLNSLGRGATFKEISKPIVENIQIPLPSLEKQIYISSVLKKCRDIITLRKQQIILFDELIKSRFVEMFGNPITNPKKWVFKPLSDCLENIENGRSFVCENSVRIGGFPAILKLSAATYGVYKPNENKAMTEESLFVNAAEVHDGDLLFTRKNTPDLVGMCAYVYNTPPRLMMPDLIFRLNTSDNCNKIYLWKLINHELFREQIKNLASGSAQSMSNISKERLMKLKIPLPSLDLQNQFAHFVQQVDKLKFAYSKLEKDIFVNHVIECDIFRSV